MIDSGVIFKGSVFFIGVDPVEVVIRRGGRRVLDNGCFAVRRNQRDGCCNVSCAACVRFSLGKGDAAQTKKDNERNETE